MKITDWIYEHTMEIWGVCASLMLIIIFYLGYYIK